MNQLSFPLTNITLPSPWPRALTARQCTLSGLADSVPRVGPAGGQPDEDAEEWGGAWINLSSAAACAGLVSVLRGPHPITLPRGFDRIKAPTLQLGPLSGLAHFFPQWGFIESFDGRGGSTGQGSGAFSPSTGRDTGEPGRLKNIPYGCHLARDLRVCVRGTTRGTRVTRTRATRHCLPTT